MINSDLKDHYNQLWSRSIKEFESGKFITDKMIDDPEDDRYGLTLLFRPSLEIRSNISEVLKKLKYYAPDQYYYPVSDMHVTVLSIISCTRGFRLDQIDRGKYLSVLQPILENTEPFNIEFNGITASPEAMMVCGYPAEESLNKLRDQVRSAFNRSDLFHTIDTRYPLKTAHVTSLRFRSGLSDHKSFTECLNEVKNTDFGTDVINTVELVGNDWYQRNENRELVKNFQL